MNRLFYIAAFVVLLSGCANRQTASVSPQNLQVGVRDKYLFEAMQPKREVKREARRVVIGQTMSVAWSGDVFRGFRVWTSTDLQSWSVAAEGPRPIYGFTFTNTFPVTGNQTFVNLELWK